MNNFKKIKYLPIDPLNVCSEDGPWIVGDFAKMYVEQYVTTVSVTWRPPSIEYVFKNKEQLDITVKKCNEKYKDSHITEEGAITFNFTPHRPCSMLRLIPKFYNTIYDRLDEENIKCGFNGKELIWHETLERTL